MPSKKPIPKKPKEWWEKGGEGFYEYLMEMLGYFRDKMFLHGYAINNQYEDKPEVDGVSGTIYAYVSVSHPYMTVDVTWGKPLYELWKQGNYWKVAETVCHELCHVTNSMLYDLAERGCAPIQRQELRDAKEKATTWMTHVVMNLVPEEVWNAKRDGTKAKGRGRKEV